MDCESPGSWLGLPIALRIITQRRMQTLTASESHQLSLHSTFEANQASLGIEEVCSALEHVVSTSVIERDVFTQVRAVFLTLQRNENFIVEGLEKLLRAYGGDRERYASQVQPDVLFAQMKSFHTAMSKQALHHLALRTS